MRAPPSQLQRVCVGPGPPTSPQHGGRVNISWDPLPCHLQNGADVVGYIIRYTHLLTGASVNIFSSDSQLDCRQEPGGPYSCVAPASLFTLSVAYSFQVAAQSIHGVGPFNYPITTVYGSQGKVLLLISQYMVL